MTIKKFLSSMALAIFAGLSVYAVEPREYRLEVADFTELKVNDKLNVNYRCSADSAGQVYFTTTPDVAMQLIFTSNKEQLKIQVTDDYYPDKFPTMTVYSSMLEKVENASDSTVRVINNVPVKEFKAKVIGNGSIFIDEVEANTVDISLMTGRGQIMVNDGRAFKTSIVNVGTGTVQAGKLISSQVKVKIGGTGNVDCYAGESLSVYGMGSGKVYYAGNPGKVTNRSVGVKAYPVEN